MTAIFQIEQVGPFVSVQDRGRYGYARFGVTDSGPMDRMSFELAQYAAGQPHDAPAIEISMGGLVLNCTEGEVTAAIAGGHFDLELDGQQLAPWSLFTLSAGSKLKIRPGPWGGWCYLSFMGDIVSDSWLGSQSTHLTSGLCGAPFAPGDVIKVENPRIAKDVGGSFFDPDPLKPDINIRIVMGPQDKYFTEESISKIELTEYKLTQEYSRMGIRLSGEKLEISHELDMPSEAIARGSMQVPGHGDPICLMADHQTTGGYPKVATIISMDQDRLVQLRTGDTVRFKKMSVEEANDAARQYRQHIDQLKVEIDKNRVSFLEKLWSNNLISGVVGPSDE